MTKLDKIIQHTHNLPEIYQTEVLDFVEFLENKTRIKTGIESQPTDFWDSPSLEELAVFQGIKPMTDISTIAGTWPGTDDDWFEEDILALRQVRKKRSKS